MAAALPNPSFQSVILRLPSNLRSRALRRISANANGSGAAKKQSKGRSRKDADARLAQVMGIYCIESNVTGALAASIGGASPATLASTGMTPATTVISTSELDPVTWAAPGAKVVTVSAPAGMQGEAVVTV